MFLWTLLVLVDWFECFWTHCRLISIKLRLTQFLYSRSVSLQMITNIQFLKQFSLCWRFFCSKPERSSFFNFTLCIHNENHHLVSFCSSVLWDVVCFRTECCSSFSQITVIIRLCFQVLVCLFLYLNVNN